MQVLSKTYTLHLITTSTFGIQLRKKMIWKTDVLITTKQHSKGFSYDEALT
jgi:hypothetical protein